MLGFAPWTGPAAAQERHDLSRLREAWTDADERGYSEFIQAIGDSACRTIDQCLKNPANPFARSDPPGVTFRADCADLPYFLRAYYAWKRGLPFSYISAVSPKGSTSDIRYTARGNDIASRRDILTGTTSGLDLLVNLRNTISSAMYRLHPDMEGTDLYPVRIDRKAIRPGRVLYDPNGHLAVVYNVEDDGRILYIDAHPDNSLTRGTYGRKFVRSSPGMGAGFKNWRPVEACRRGQDARGHLCRRHDRVRRERRAPRLFDRAILRQRRASRRSRMGERRLHARRPARRLLRLHARDDGRRLARLRADREVRNMMRANCEDIRYRAEAVDLAIQNGIHLKSQPPRLPPNIYGTEGEWEEFSTPSRDARLKTSFKELRDQVQRFVEWHAAADKRIHYQGRDLLFDLLQAYDHEAAACTITYLQVERHRRCSSAMKKCAGACSCCRSIPITASNGAGARPSPPKR